MNQPRFLQIHTLTPYTAVLLNRDDSGLAKRLPYGGALRTRISSQCLKRHWRIAEDPYALGNIEGVKAATRSRELVTKKVIDPLREQFSKEIVDAIEPAFQEAVYGNKGKTKDSRPTLLFGEPELRWLKKEAERLAKDAKDNVETAKKKAEEWKGKSSKESGKHALKFKQNIKAMRKITALPAGLTAALFGRMVTSDPDANITAPVHVAHAFTVHEEEPESDYFTAVDDLSCDEPGADTIQETELTSGLFYGYVVVDLPGLSGNLGEDDELAGRVLHNLIHLIAEISPGAKLGSTAPYGRASFMLLEAGDRQPRSLAEAYRSPCEPHLGRAIEALSEHLETLDKTYATGEERQVLSLLESKVPRADRGSLAELAKWAQNLPSRMAS